MPHGQVYEDPRVSIHAPVKGATDPLLDKLKLEEVSIHAPVKGATKILAAVNRKTVFQSTPP